MLGGYCAVFVLYGLEAFVIFSFQDIQLILGSQGFYRVGPYNIAFVRTFHQRGIVGFAGDADKSLVAVAHFIVVLLFLVLADEFAETGVSLCILIESIVIVGFRIEQHFH